MKGEMNMDFVMELTEDTYLERGQKERQQKEKEVMSKLVNIYENGNEDIKLIISMLVHEQFNSAIHHDNEIRRNTKDNSKIHYLKDYEEQYKEVIEKCWEV